MNYTRLKTELTQHFTTLKPGEVEKALDIVRRIQRNFEGRMVWTIQAASAIEGTLALAELNERLGLRGVRHLECKKSSCYYLEAEKPEDATFLFDVGKRRLYFTSWKAWISNYEREHGETCEGAPTEAYVPSLAEPGEPESEAEAGSADDETTDNGHAPE